MDTCTPTILIGNAVDVLRTLERDSIDCVCTSPPYWAQRDYNCPGQIGLEPTVDLYVDRLADVFSEVKRVMKPGATCWINIGDSYASNWGMGALGRKASWWSNRSDDLEGKGWGLVRTAIKANSFKGARTDHLKVKDLVGVPWRLALRLQKDGFYIRSDIIWDKPSAREIRVLDRPMNAHEHLFLMTKSPAYYYDGPGIDAALGKRCRNVWSIATSLTKSVAHFATFPEKLIEPAIIGGCPRGGVVLDPFAGSGTTGLVASRLERRSILIEVNSDYADLLKTRTQPR